MSSLPGYPLSLGIIAFLAGLLALVSAVMSTRKERKARLALPHHQIKVEVDGTASFILDLPSRAQSSEDLAARLRDVITVNTP